MSGQETPPIQHRDPEPCIEQVLIARLNDQVRELRKREIELSGRVASLERKINAASPRSEPARGSPPGGLPRGSR